MKTFWENLFRNKDRQCLAVFVKGYLLIEAFFISSNDQKMLHEITPGINIFHYSATFVTE